MAFDAAPDVNEAFQLRKPSPADGPAVTRLVAACAPLDSNSAYCNLLQCTHFTDSCLVAERHAQILGWVSGYRPPSEPNSFFVWQVAVAKAARGKGLAQRMINALLDRPSAESAKYLLTTVTDDNAPSWALFNGLARAWGAPLIRSVMFECDAHFAGKHATEWLARIGPLPNRLPGARDQEN
ncbi:diaminobutyrate acetyltransferase [Bradyrhizobium brasilense]|uniref:diaminobutyrate acetyltransferase n=1 Tax=Bradyrhizobium brasilense TaxID=1419277 RepID=UPI003222171C